jgi:hypothetical protein
MTRRTSARVAGFAYLFYIATAFPAMVLFSRATAGEGTAAQLASIARHASAMRLSILLVLLDCVVAMVLAVALYGITRDEDHEIALLAMICRFGEGLLAAIGVLLALGLLWLSGTQSVDAGGAQALGALLLHAGAWNTTICATLFAVGSTLFSYLLLRGRMIPVWLAWLGVIASVLLVIALPGQLIGSIEAISMTVWLPMLVFEVVLGLWLMIKGAAAPRARAA